MSTNLPCYAIPTTLVSRPTELDLATTTTTYLSTYFGAIKFDRDYIILKAHSRLLYSILKYITKLVARRRII